MKKILLLLLALYGWNAYCQNVGLKLEYQYKDPSDGQTITGHGTAVCISKTKQADSISTTMITAAHNVLDAKGDVRKDVFVNGDRVQVIKVCEKYDVALLRGSVDVACVELGEDAKVGDKIVLSGSKRGMPVTEHEGRIIEKDHKGWARDLMSVDFDHGDSGGAVLQNGKLVGIAVDGVPDRSGHELRHDLGLFTRVSLLRQEFLK